MFPILFARAFLFLVAHLFVVCPAKSIWNTCMLTKPSNKMGNNEREKNSTKQNRTVFFGCCQWKMMFGQWNRLSLLSCWHHPRKVTVITVINPVSCWPVRESVPPVLPPPQIKCRISAAKVRMRQLSQSSGNELVIHSVLLLCKTSVTLKELYFSGFVPTLACLHYMMQKTKKQRGKAVLQQQVLKCYRGTPGTCLWDFHT